MSIFGIQLSDLNPLQYLLPGSSSLQDVVATAAAYGIGEDQVSQLVQTIQNLPAYTRQLNIAAAAYNQMEDEGSADPDQLAQFRAALDDAFNAVLDANDAINEAVTSLMQNGSISGTDAQWVSIDTIYPPTSLSGSYNPQTYVWVISSVVMILVAAYIVSLGAPIVAGIVAVAGLVSAAAGFVSSMRGSPTVQQIGTAASQAIQGVAVAGKNIVPLALIGLAGLGAWLYFGKRRALA